jgi:hypothetical protein
MRILRFRGAACALTIAALAAGCGGSDEPAAPTSISEADLQKTGEFWNSLTPDLKDELADACKERVGGQRADSSGDPSVANRIQSIPTAEVVSYVDKQYANQSKLGSEISINCGGAIDENIQQSLDEALGELGQQGG